MVVVGLGEDSGGPRDHTTPLPLCRYVGAVDGMAAGLWVGVALDEPLGRHDGSKGGRRYFETADGHGIFVRPGSVTLGSGIEAVGLGSDDEI